MSFILDKTALKAVCHTLHSQDKSIVLTHGAYDLLHIGHIEFLRRSKEQGRYLIVGVDSDERIVRYKHIHRPFLPLQQRMEMLINLKFVDAVFEIDGGDLSDTYFYRLYQAIKPTVVTAGGPHKFVENVVHRIDVMKRSDSFFKQTQAHVIHHPYEDIVSTTSIIDTILEKHHAA